MPHSKAPMIGVVGRSVNHSRQQPATHPSRPTRSTERARPLCNSTSKTKVGGSVRPKQQAQGMSASKHDETETQFQIACKEYLAPAGGIGLNETKQWQQHQRVSSQMWCELSRQIEDHGVCEQLQHMIPQPKTAPDSDPTACGVAALDRLLSEAETELESPRMVQLGALLQEAEAICGGAVVWLTLGSHLWAKIVASGGVPAAGASACSCRELDALVNSKEDQIWQGFAEQLIPNLHKTSEPQPAGTRVASSFKQACEWHVCGGKMSVWAKAISTAAMSILDETMGTLERAHGMLNDLNMVDCVQAKSMLKPPAAYHVAGHLHRLLLREDTSTLCMGDWEYLKRVLSDHNWIRRLIDYDKDNISQSVHRQLVATIEKQQLDLSALVGACGSRDGPGKVPAAICATVQFLLKYHANTQIILPMRPALAYIEKEMSELSAFWASGKGSQYDSRSSRTRKGESENPQAFVRTTTESQ